MSQTNILKPAAGLKLRKPDGSFLADEGEAVVIDSFWKRRLKDGDAVEVKPAAPAAGKSK